MLLAERAGDRIPVGEKFPTTVQTGPGAHTATSKVGTGLSPWGKSVGALVDLPPPSSAEVKERVEMYPLFRFWA